MLNFPNYSKINQSMDAWKLINQRYGVYGVSFIYGILENGSVLTGPPCFKKHVYPIFMTIHLRIGIINVNIIPKPCSVHFNWQPDFFLIRYRVVAVFACLAGAGAEEEGIGGGGRYGFRGGRTLRAHFTSSSPSSMCRR